jgi:hypothetical protein
MKSIVVRHRNSGYCTTITPLAEDSKHWYVLKTKGKDISDTLRYSKTDFDFMGERLNSKS